MDLATKLVELEKRTAQHRELLLTEEAAKTALVLPFFQALGYDVFNPSEVIPEFTADALGKKGEKVDYALCADGKLNILVECKPSTVDLDIKHAAQLFRYFQVTDARVAILTNGVEYKFFSDTEKPNIMDDKPFFSFSMDTIRRSDPATLERFMRHQFDISAIIAEAGRLKLESLVRTEIEREFAQPSEEWVKLIAKRVSPAQLTAAMREQYGQLIAAAIAQLIRDRVNERLTSALHVANPEPATIEEGATDDPSEGDGVITTEDEIGGFRIVQAIAARHVDPGRVVSRHPDLVDFSHDNWSATVEQDLPSGDCADILFTAPRHVRVVEVKPVDAPIADVTRGLFQCVKYRAVMDAKMRFIKDKRKLTVCLALGGSLPEKLVPLRNSLNVEVFENLGRSLQVS